MCFAHTGKPRGYEEAVWICTDEGVMYCCLAIRCAEMAGVKGDCKQAVAGRRQGFLLENQKSVRLEGGLVSLYYS
jgi:hypothetical protein